MSKRKQTGAATEDPVTSSGIEMGTSSGGREHKDAGSVRYCMCPNCGIRIFHKPGEPCLTTICPQCGSQMMKKA